MLFPYPFLRKIVDKLNNEYFGGLINIQEIIVVNDFDEDSTLAQYRGDKRAGDIYILLRHLDDAYEEVEDTVFHEMAHQIYCTHSVWFCRLMDCYKNRDVKKLREILVRWRRKRK